jgi:hypothetical protein
MSIESLYFSCIPTSAGTFEIAGDFIGPVNVQYVLLGHEAFNNWVVNV